VTLASCPKGGCSVAESGICLLSHRPPTSCPNFRPAEGVLSTTPPIAESSIAPENVLEADEASKSPAPGERRFHIGLELGTDDALAISRGRYCHLIGVLGASGAGKTCCLLALYLSALHGRLPHGYRFAGSLTLKGFEDRARRLRQWTKGPLPTQLADHTVLGNPREAALLHMSLRQGPAGRRVDLLLTDLPGEWSKTLIDRASTAERLAFLQRADGIVVVVDGKRLESVEKNAEVLQTKHLFERLKTNVGIDLTIPFTLLVSKGDEIEMRLSEDAKDIIQHARSLGFKIEPIVAAAFSYNTKFESGTGVFEAIERLIDEVSEPAEKAVAAPAREARQFSGFGDTHS
jgi:GTPase SAR1 family protein